MVLSGGLAYGYQTAKTNDAAGVGTTTKGFGVDTAAFTMAASEDLGGGLKLAGSMALGGLTRGDTPSGEDFKMVLSGGFGSVLLGQIEIGSGIRGLAQAGAPVNNMEGEILAPATAGTDIIKYTAPKFGDITVSGSLTEAKGLANGLSNGQVSALTVGADYAAGPIAAKFDFTDWDNDSKAANNRYRVAGSYDFGVAKVGAGFEHQKWVKGANTGTINSQLSVNGDALKSVDYTVLGVSAPVGSALTVGLVWTQAKVKGEDGTSEKLKGYSLGAKYDLSKRTNVTANTAKWDSALADGKSNTKTTFLLNHSF